MVMDESLKRFKLYLKEKQNTCNFFKKNRLLILSNLILFLFCSGDGS